MTALLHLPRGLSARLLVLTVAFVMASEVLIFLPSLSRFRLSWFADHVDAAHLAVFALEATPDNMVSHRARHEAPRPCRRHGIVVHKSDT